ncbi:hypothetical protein NYQ31_11840 [Curtobacterium flaccumfaciens]|uniref:hypothetical protein n=1 Tax=Curtobacterium flaccumfaciens TaxID=2035 RepID=UPI00217D6088|nr:hypothetical protein [Curtobacterium flaccumfaciens]MCS6559091.1 hypothetical protein [Curtobacterium flaccumfaciens]
MTNCDHDAILDAIFASAASEGRKLGAAELMHAIGLQRTSIYSTFAHVNVRRIEHNQRLTAEQPSHAAPARRAREDAHAATVARLTSQLERERARSEQYAQVIRRLTIANHELQYGGGVVTDGRHRFGERGLATDLGSENS